MPNVFFASLKMAMMSSVITSPAMQSGKQGGKTPTFSREDLARGLLQIHALFTAVDVGREIGHFAHAETHVRPRGERIFQIFARNEFFQPAFQHVERTLVRRRAEEEQQISAVVHFRKDVMFVEYLFRLVRRYSHGLEVHREFQRIRVLEASVALRLQPRAERRDFHAAACSKAPCRFPP